MKHKQMVQGVCAAAGILILILDSKTALAGASQGIELCLKTVIPSLFPFFVLSILLSASLSGMTIPLLRWSGRLFRIPKGSESILIPAFLGGYPVGAQCITQLWHNGVLQKEEAERLLSFCSNAGPAFLFGMLSSYFPKKWMVWALWFIHIASALLVSRMIPWESSRMISTQLEKQVDLPAAVSSAIWICAQVCGWVLLFRIATVFLSRWFLWLLPVPIQVIVIGMLELANGCCSLSVISDISIRFLVCSGMIAFGGVCVLMQTASVTQGLSLRPYIIGKSLQACFSLLICAAVWYQGWMLIVVALLPLPTIWRNRQKNSSIQTLTGV